MSPVITIDGPSGAGKSTVGRTLASRLGYDYIDSGALYRIVALEAIQQNIDTNNDDDLVRICDNLDVTFSNRNGKSRVFCRGNDVSGLIRTQDISMLASRISARKSVRDSLTSLQRRMGEHGDIVLEGRDAGTVVFPDAAIKIFLDASPEERGRRRFEELRLKSSNVSLTQVTQDLIKRDDNDRSRRYAPLAPAQDAVIIDSTAMTVEEVIEKILKMIKPKK